MFRFSLIFVFAVSTQAAPELSLYPLISLQEHLPPFTEDDRMVGEDPRVFVQAGGEDDLPVTPPQVEMTAREDLRRISLSIAFNWVLLGEGHQRRPVWFARLRAASWDKAIERFADSRQCPEVEQSLAQLDHLPALRPRVPSLPDPKGRTLDSGGYLHDNTYQIRLHGRYEGGTYPDKIEITGGSSTPLAPVVAESLKRLLPCWTSTPPPLA